MGRPRILTSAQEESIVSAYKAGELLTGALAHAHNVHEDTIRNVLRRHGVPLRSRGGLPKELRTPAVASS